MSKNLTPVKKKWLSLSKSFWHLSKSSIYVEKIDTYQKIWHLSKNFDICRNYFCPRSKRPWFFKLWLAARLENFLGRPFFPPPSIFYPWGNSTAFHSSDGNRSINWAFDSCSLNKMTANWNSFSFTLELLLTLPHTLNTHISTILFSCSY